MKNKDHVELDFHYTGLQKNCILYESLKHEFEMCKESSHLQQRQYELLDIATNPYMIVQEQSTAIGEYLSTMEVNHLEQQT